MDKTFASYRIEERSYVAYIKREIHREVANTRFNEQKRGEIDIIVSELASNLVKHAKGGDFLYRVYDEGEKDSVFEMLCIDSGVGMADPAKMMRDGVSTTHTLGQGLGAIQRLSDNFQLYSLPKWGTIIYSMVTTNSDKTLRKSATLDVDISALCVNKPKETVCGDAFAMKRTDSTIQIFLGDGLGHGEHAHEAVKKAVSSFTECEESDPVSILRYMHEKVRRTRGLVASVAVLDLKSKYWKICAVGNILTRLYTGITFRNYLSYNGTVGMNIPNSLHNSEFDAEKNQFLVMCSDGIRSRYDISKYPSVLKYDMMVLAGAIYKDYTRGNDDSSIVVAKVS
ncbi:ATP-binding protein [Chryseosolibacter indicus]|uniref:ATP-binding protein n=1 Tax=Chryseosolibacter indicus TaxID=2782351 RepID=A0ABS5VZI9_9BACT|nr:ATP-binding protein [Chryseosolibacter indicus]MBT1706159.1 ATP-binding protein [Chryseosolibacter indicus]